jgi:hypothetical protein
MRIIFTLSTILLLNCPSFSQAVNPDTFLLDQRAMIFLETKVKEINFKTCDEEIIVDFINNYFNKDLYQKSNEFEKKRFINQIRDTLDKNQNEYSFNDVYAYTTRRLLGDYDFKEMSFPIIGNYYVNGGRFSYKQYKDESQVILNHISNGLNLINEDDFPLALKFNESEAEKILALKKEFRKQYLDSVYKTMDAQTRNWTQSHEGIKFKDDYGNFSENEDRTILFRYYVKILNPTQSKSAKKKVGKIINSLANTNGTLKLENEPNQIKAQIVRMFVYLNRDKDSYNNDLYNYYPDGKQEKLFTIK